MIVNQGRLMWARGLFGAGIWSSSVSSSTPVSWGGFGSSATINSYTINSITTSSGSLQGNTLVVFSPSTGSVVYSNVLDNPSANHNRCTLSIDQWYTPGTDGTVPGKIPENSTSYLLFTGLSPSWYVALGNGDMSTINNSTTNLPGEITTSGLKRKPGVVAMSAAPSSATTSGNTVITITSVFTAGNRDTLPAIINGIGLFNTLGTASGTGYTGLMFATPFSVSAQLNSIGDQLTVTEQITGP
jgi:hypothetical protein